MRCGPPVRRWATALAAILVAASSFFALHTVSGLAASSLAQAGNDIDCSLDSTGKIPLIDLGEDSYRGAEGGLYPDGSNETPAAHEALGMVRAAEITPRDAQGRPDPDGVIAFVSIGVSNTRREFTAFIPVAEADPDLADSVVLVNLAQNGEPVDAWLDPNANVWSLVDRALADAGVTAAQVQGAWVKIPARFSDEEPKPFPVNAFDYRNELAAALRTIETKLPNLEVAYLSSRIYGGYNAVTSSNPEPNAYEEGFAVKWLIEQQMAGNPVLNADPGEGEVVAPWIAWGPYLWADGATPRSDGLTWDCDELNSDGIHPNGEGSDQVAELLLDFLHGEPTAAWLFGDDVAAGGPVATGTVTTSTLPGDPGLSAETLPSPTAAGPGRPDTVGPSTTAGSADPGTVTGDTTRRERREQQRAEREQERQEELSGTEAPETGDTSPGSTLAGAPTTGTDEVPVVVWVLAGAGAVMLLFLAGRAIRERVRPDRREPPAAG